MLSIHHREPNGRSGDVIRIAPNELVFLTPQAAKGQLLDN